MCVHTCTSSYPGRDLKQFLNLVIMHHATLLGWDPGWDTAEGSAWRTNAALASCSPVLYWCIMTTNVIFEWHATLKGLSQLKPTLRRSAWYYSFNDWVYGSYTPRPLQEYRGTQRTHTINMDEVYICVYFHHWGLFGGRVDLFCGHEGDVFACVCTFIQHNVLG